MRSRCVSGWLSIVAGPAADERDDLQNVALRDHGLGSVLRPGDKLLVDLDGHVLGLEPEVLQQFRHRERPGHLVTLAVYRDLHSRIHHAFSGRKLNATRPTRRTGFRIAMARRQVVRSTQKASPVRTSRFAIPFATSSYRRQRSPVKLPRCERTAPPLRCMPYQLRKDDDNNPTGVTPMLVLKFTSAHGLISS